MGSKYNMGCKKHPKHKQSPGVCSVCLGERLSKLSASSSSKSANKVGSYSSCSSSSSLSSCYSSGDLSPVHHKYRLDSNNNVTMSGALIKSGGEEVFRRNKSVAAVERWRKGEEGEKKNKKKKNGFWSKLLRLRKKKFEVELVTSSMITTTRVH